MQLGHVDINRIRGIADKIIGLSEETIGVVVGIDHWQGEGEARQERASQELKALRKAAKAEAKAAKADAELHEAQAKEHEADKAFYGESD